MATARWAVASLKGPAPAYGVRGPALPSGSVSRGPAAGPFSRHGLPDR